ncbi:MAG TPA: cytochrome c maturation protein CcmE [Thermoanaerobaculia bacterium]|nr:cytochrome c maturation protein CcmE [Thermoanaerobaculia bacterium]
MKKQRVLYAFGTLLLVGFAGFAVSSFKQTLTPYVSFAEARRIDRNLQVAGGLVAGSSQYRDAEESLLFTLHEPDSGDTLRVRYQGLKPANFEEAVSIVAIGRWDGGAGELAADKLLVKCPSKYQGVEEAEVKEYSAST